MEWRDIKGYEGLYQVSDSGDVRGIDRKCTGKRNRFIKGKILKKTKTTTGYWKVDLSKDGKQVSRKVHRLVAIAFIDNPEQKPYINHIDNNPLNNNVNNLEWCTQSENVSHAYKIGAYQNRTKSYVATDDIVASVLAEYVPYDREHGIRAICKRIGISESTIYSAIRSRRSYL